MNILYIHTHDSGRVIGPYGHTSHTPQMDSFADDAVLFGQAYCVSPTCSPSRAALLTGCYPHQNGMLGLAQRGFTLDADKHLARYLAGQGYHTALCGIQHEYGWYLDHHGSAEVLGYHEDFSTDNSGYRQEDLPDWDARNAEAVCNWLASYNSDSPFFLSYGMYATHRRYPDKLGEGIDPDHLLPPAYLPNSSETRDDYAHYLTSLQSADRCFGMVIDALRSRGLYDNTLVIFTTDHGLANPFGKCTLFDSGTGVLLMVRYPDAPQNGQRVDSLVSHVDVFPTICELLELPAPRWLEGRSFAGSLSDPNAEGDELVFGEINFHTSYEPVRSVRSSRYKYIRYYDEGFLQTNLSNIDESLPKEYLLKRGLAEQPKYSQALYDLDFDPSERCNLAGDPERAQVLQQLATAMDSWQERTSDPLLGGEIALQPHWKVNKRSCHAASSRNPEDYDSLGITQ